MNTRARWVAMALFSLAVVSFSYLSHAEETTATRSASTAGKAKTGDAQDTEAHQIKIEKKLAKILENQDALLQAQQTLNQRLDAIMEELRIIKVRSTR